MKSIRNSIILISVAGVAAASRQTASSFAQSWLRAHGAPQQDELAELKDTNPEAYGIVKALLTKRSLGLLNMRHPSASFASAKPDSDSAPSGAAAFTMTEEDRAVIAKPNAVVEPVDAVQSPAIHKHRDFWSWKPSDSAADDESMVSNVLGEVAKVAGTKKPVGSLLSNRRSSSSTLSGDEALVGGKLAVDVAKLDAEERADKATAASPATAPVLAAAPVELPGNGYLANTGFGVSPATRKPRAANLEENSYLRGLDLVPNTATPKTAEAQYANGPASGSYLASFSWGDSAPQPIQEQSAVVAAPDVVSDAPEPQKKTALNSLSSWLDGPAKKDILAELPEYQPARSETTASPYSWQW